jgi:hypothetical protein
MMSNLNDMSQYENTYEVSENNNASIDYYFRNPNIDFDQFRSNFVFRWDYRPGS